MQNSYQNEYFYFFGFNNVPKIRKNQRLNT